MQRGAGGFDGGVDFLFTCLRHAGDQATGDRGVLVESASARCGNEIAGDEIADILDRGVRLARDVEHVSSPKMLRDLVAGEDGYPRNRWP